MNLRTERPNVHTMIRDGEICKVVEAGVSKAPTAGLKWVEGPCMVDAEAKRERGLPKSCLGVTGRQGHKIQKRVHLSQLFN